VERGGEGGIRTRGAFAHRFSRAAPSTTRTPLRGRGYQTGPAGPVRRDATACRDGSRYVRWRPRASLTHPGCARSGPRLRPRLDYPRGALRSEAVSFGRRARRGTSGALYLQSAIAGLNPLPRSPFSDAARRRDVEDRVPRSGEPRTVSGPEGSSTKRSSSGAAERPGPSRSSWWARERSGRRRVHGKLISLVRPDRRRS
jgi:hypothetical protein